MTKIWRSCNGRARRNGLLRFGQTAVMLVAFSVAGVPAATASPSLNNCFNNSGIPCYARGVFYNGKAYGGGYVDVKVTGTSASGSSWLNETLWVTTNGNTEGYWAEIGYTDNNPLCRGKRSWYYTYVNPRKTVQRCISGAVTKGDWYTLEIQKTSSDAYGIYLNYKLVATDKGASGWTYYVYTGAEYHLETVNTNGDARFADNQVRTTKCCTWHSWPTGSSDVSYPQDLNWHWTKHWTQGYDSGSD
jgi:hypothetical protein